MNIKVHIEYTDEFNQTHTGISESRNLDPEVFNDAISESILDRFVRAYVATGNEKSWIIDEMEKYIAQNDGEEEG